MEPKLKNDQKYQSGIRQSTLGQFPGLSEHHSSLIANFYNLTTGNISPQYHILFDNFFETVYITGVNGPKVDAICNNLFDHKRYW